MEETIRLFARQVGAPEWSVASLSTLFGWFVCRFLGSHIWVYLRGDYLQVGDDAKEVLRRLQNEKGWVVHDHDMSPWLHYASSRLSVYTDRRGIRVQDRDVTSRFNRKERSLIRRQAKESYALLQERKKAEDLKELRAALRQGC